MVTLKEACETIRKVHPNRYIYAVNESENAFDFITVPNGWKREDCQSTLLVDLVDKRTGEYELTNVLDERIDFDHYKQYTQEEIERL